MNLQYYRDARAEGAPAAQALRNARTREKWEAKGDAVRIRYVPDDSPDLSFLDQDCYQGDREGRASAKAIRDEAEREGVWGMVAEYRCPCCGEWKHGDSIYGMIGSPSERVEFHGGYLPDLQRQTLDALREACAHGQRESAQGPPTEGR